MEDQTKYYSVTEVAQMFRVSDDTIRRMIRDGKLQAIRVGNQFRVPEAAVMAIRTLKTLGE